MPHGMTNRQGFSIHQVKRRTVLELLRGGLEQGPCHSRESVQAGDPLLIRTQARKGRTKIRRHQPISLFETRDPKQPCSRARVSTSESAKRGMSCGDCRQHSRFGWVARKSSTKIESSVT